MSRRGYRPWRDRPDNLGAMDDLSSAVGELWDRRAHLSPADAGALEVVDKAIGLLDRGEARVAEIDAETD